ncbi:hypothetical protein B0H63DRAFT_160279 [Podospora didyma]|uniref:Uncharacterized protein n=1 Tax=Podospora didyma TaxID=330526 RepID=A0AAE0NTR3_9PEZI|nr:hypothetical protein B0H63DRAFT_160279 [Podospora didyma]
MSLFHFFFLRPAAGATLSTPRQMKKPGERETTTPECRLLEERNRREKRTKPSPKKRWCRDSQGIMGFERATARRRPPPVHQTLESRRVECCVDSPFKEEAVCGIRGRMTVPLSHGGCRSERRAGKGVALGSVVLNWFHPFLEAFSGVPMTTTRNIRARPNSRFEKTKNKEAESVGTQARFPGPGGYR